jgi:dTDP-4-amino-4,6-dideoxygalactose transaminase
MPYYRNLGWKEGDLPIAENYYKHCISLPMYPTLKDDEIDFVIQKVVNYYE